MNFPLAPKFVELAQYISDTGFSQYGTDYIGGMQDSMGYCIASSEMSLVVGKALGPFQKLPGNEGPEVLVPISIDKTLDSSGENTEGPWPSVAIFNQNGLLTDYDSTYITRFIKVSPNMRRSDNPETVKMVDVWMRNLSTFVVIDQSPLKVLMDTVFKSSPELYDMRSGEPCILFRNNPRRQMVIHSNSEFAIYLRHNIVFSKAIKESVW